MSTKVAVSVLLTLTMLMPGGMFLVSSSSASVEDDDLPTMQALNGINGVQEIPLKAIMHPNKEIDAQEDAGIQPDNVITVEQSKNIVLMNSKGSITKVEVTDAKLVSTELYFADNLVKADLPSGSYILTVIVQTEDGEKYGFVTLLIVLAPTQTINQVNIQNIINAFETRNIDTRIIFEDNDNGNGNNPPGQEELSPCYFHPNTDPHCKPVNGECPEDAPNMNEQGNCHPNGCPDGYSMLDDDETGTCYSDRNVIVCEGSNAKVLRQEDCAIYDQNPTADPRQVCYFEPNDPVCDPVDGKCLEGMGFNDDGQCVPQGACPDGYKRLDDDETGRCYAEAATKICPPDNIRVLQSQPCPEVTVAGAAADNATQASDVETEDVVNDTEDVEAEPEPEPPTCQPNFILENGVCTEMSSNCGGEPCTPSQKEDSTTSDPIAGEPHTPTESEEVVEEIEAREEDNSGDDSDSDTSDDDSDTSDNDSDSDSDSDNDDNSSNDNDDEDEDEDGEDSNN